MNIKIIPAREDEIEAIRDLIYSRCLWFVENDLIGWNKKYLDDFGVDYFLKQMKKNKLYVAKVDEKICGVMLLKNVEEEDFWSDTEPSYYIHHLATDTKIKGVGQKLLEFAKEQGRKDGKKYLRLDCYEDSDFLNNYYSKMGFSYIKNGLEIYPNETYKYNLWQMSL